MKRFYDLDIINKKSHVWLLYKCSSLTTTEQRAKRKERKLMKEIGLRNGCSGELGRFALDRFAIGLQLCEVDSTVVRTNSVITIFKGKRILANV